MKTAKTPTLNEYGNATTIPAGWVPLASGRPLWVREAASKGRAVQVVRGWSGSKNYRKPILKWYAHPQVIPAPVAPKTVDPVRVAAALKAADTRRKKEVNRLAQLLDERQVSEGLRPILLSFPHWGKIAVESLRDVNEANSDWLRDMLVACVASDEQHGIMYAWAKGRTELEFHDAARRALAAHRRHNLTDYDANLAATLRGLKGGEREDVYHEAKRVATAKGRQVATTAR